VVRRASDGAVQVLSSVVSTQIAKHAPYGGVVPEIAARAHVEVIDVVIAEAMREAGLGFEGLDGVAATAGPGLVGGVMVGLSAGKAIALARGLPLAAVNHLEGHAVSARLSEAVDYPFLLLLVSGGHCQLLEPYPGGPALEKLAERGDASRFTLPRALLGREGFDFSFSGLKTAAARLAEGLQTEQERADLAAAVQAAIARQLAERTKKAMAAYAGSHAGRPLNFVVAGGVAANRAVREALTEAAAEHGFAFYAPALAYCTDNAAMIALAGAERLAVGLKDGLDAVARPRWPLDEAAALASPTHLPGRKGAKA